jgi:hypothetical protein
MDENKVASLDKELRNSDPGKGDQNHTEGDSKLLLILHHLMHSASEEAPKHVHYMLKVGM